MIQYLETQVIPCTHILKRTGFLFHVAVPIAIALIETSPAWTYRSRSQAVGQDKAYVIIPTHGHSGRDWC